MNPGRNDPCPCGSGKRYKACCGQLGSAPVAVEAAPAEARATPTAPPDPVTAAEKRQFINLVEAGRYWESEKLARELTRWFPNSGFAWKALGVSLKLQGKLALAELERAAQLMPHDAEAQSNLGVAQLDLGRCADAEQSLRRSLALRSDRAETHNDLGNALRGLGRLEEAVASYARALSIAPARAEVHGNLGQALHRLRRPEEALASFRRALELKSDLVEAHVGRCNVLLELGRLEEAIEGYRQLLQMRPDLAEGHGNLGSALLNLGRLTEAAASYRQAIALTPDYAEAHHNLAITMRLLGSASEAEASASRALELNPELAAAWTVRADLQADRGDFVQAEQLFRRALSLDADLTEGWAGLAQLRRMTTEDLGWRDEALRLLSKALPPRKEVQLRYALGKFFDDVGDFDQAFAHYRRANELSRAHRLAHDRSEVTRGIDALISLYSRPRLEAARVHGLGSSRPVFIVGMPRSGTTLAEQILASHPEVFGAGELTFWNAAGPLPESAQALRALGEDYLRLLGTRSVGAERVIDKMPANFLQLGLIHAALPGARIIHLQRDPIDTCLSVYFQDFRATLSYANDLGDLAHFYGEYVRLMQHWRSIIPEKALLDVPYESLVDDPETWSRRMLAFIGVPWDPRCLEFQRTERNVLTASKWQVRQGISKMSIGRWRHYEKHIGELLSLRGT